MGFEALGAVALSGAIGALGNESNNQLAAQQNANSKNSGGTPGVNTTKSSGKAQTGLEGIPQLDPTQAIEWFKEAAQVQSEGFDKGLSYYTKALDVARNEIQKSYVESNATLKPLAFASQQAMNESLRMMGIAPLSTTDSYSSRVGAIGNFTELQKSLADAERITDPQQRQNVKQQILGQFNAAGQSAVDAASNKLSSISAAPTQWSAYGADALKWGGDIPPQLLAEMKAAGYNVSGSGGPYAPASPDDIAQANAYIATYDKRLASYNEQKTALTEALASAKSQQQQLNDLSTNYNRDYSQTMDKGYTGQEVTDKITATPGYQFQMEQGTKAVERQGAAAGMLGSANTLLGLQKYGQDLAQNYYNSYMQNLSNIASLGSGALGQLADNQIGEGSAYSALSQLKGSAQNQNEVNKASAKADSLNRQAQMFYDAAKYNTGLQYDRFQSLKSGSGGVIQSVPGLMNASTNQALLNYQIFQNQQGGAAYAGTLSRTTGYL